MFLDQTICIIEKGSTLSAKTSQRAAHWSANSRWYYQTHYVNIVKIHQREGEHKGQRENLLLQLFRWSRRFSRGTTNWSWHREKCLKFRVGFRVGTWTFR